MKWDYTCKDCGVNTKKGKINFYGVTEELWGKYGVGKGMLCLECFKKRLGREFVREDFIPCFLNYFVNPVVRDIIKPTEEEVNCLFHKLRKY
ncbi:hypothetical protein [Shivajiella indica]|uniref:Uncharacterized protein n=1 Tax=Shivajiella indica TaxID=872115 RepID=A0ABW5BCB9_9BACT